MKVFQRVRWNERRRERRGLTLMELVVVLAILAAVAGIVIPLLPNLLRRAHKATDATQSGELAKAIQTYQASYYSYPDMYDLLTDDTGAFPAYLPADGGAVFGGYVNADTLTQAELKALSRVGIKFIQKMATDGAAPKFHPSRHPYPDATPTAGSLVDIDSEAGSATSASKFALLNATDLRAGTLDNHLLEAELASDPTARYVVFGVGPRCSMVGKIIQDAPMSVPQDKTLTPDTVYAHFGVIFKVSGLEVERTERARLVAAVALEDDELEGTDKDIVGYYEVSKDPSIH